MAIQTGSTLTWADISFVLGRVNTARSHCGFGNISISGGGVGTLARSQNLADLYNGLRAVHGKVLPAQGGTVSVASIAIPAVGTIIYPATLVAIRNEADRIAALNFSGFNSSFNSSHNASGFNSGFSFNSGFNSSHNGFGFNSSFDGFGFNSGFNSSHDGFGFNSGFNSGHNSGFNSGFNSGHRSFSCSCQSFSFSCGSSQTFSKGGGNSGFNFSFRFLDTRDDNYRRQRRLMFDGKTSTRSESGF